MKKGRVEKHFDKVAKDYDFYKKKNAFYYFNLKSLLKELISEDKKVLEIGCGTGGLLSSLKPKIGYGMDISGEMIKIAKSKYKSNKHLHFSTQFPVLKSSIYNLYSNDSFDYIFMSDVIEHLEDPRDVFSKVSKLMNKKTFFVITMANPVWEPMLMFWEKMGWKMEEGPHHRAGIKECRLWIKESEMKIVKHDYKLLIPVNIPVITNFANKYLEKPLRKLAFIEYFVAKKQ